MDPARALREVMVSGRWAMQGDTSAQGLTLVHFSAQLERFLWDRGCA
jgi:hypothetical protein